MPITYKIIPMGDYLLIESQGKPASFEEFRAYYLSYIKELDESGLRRVLVDSRKVDYAGLDYHDLIAFMDDILIKGRNLIGNRTAVLSGLSNKAHYSRLESLAVNRSFSFRWFTTMDSALEWLLRP